MKVCTKSAFLDTFKNALLLQMHFFPINQSNEIFKQVNDWEKNPLFYFIFGFGLSRYIIISFRKIAAHNIMRLFT